MKCLPSPPPAGPPEGGPPPPPGPLLPLLSPPPPPPGGPPPPLSLLKSAYSSTFLTKNLDAPLRPPDPFKTMLLDSCNDRQDDNEKRGSILCGDTQDMQYLVLSIRCAHEHIL